MCVSLKKIKIKVEQILCRRGVLGKILHRALAKGTVVGGLLTLGKTARAVRSGERGFRNGKRQGAFQERPTQCPKPSPDRIRFARPIGHRQRMAIIACQPVRPGIRVVWPGQDSGGRHRVGCFQKFTHERVVGVHRISRRNHHNEQMSPAFLRSRQKPPVQHREQARVQKLEREITDEHDRPEFKFP
jgi:hypothetical protein